MWYSLNFLVEEWLKQESFDHDFLEDDFPNMGENKKI